ncbi:MAG: hypothetical protein IT454_21990, partial [Planctomycetes bacterium]|nr:hypothetical protein [Planctomycetota bacterium]
RGNVYRWPDEKNRNWRGFSYTIPKEEQIRSELYRELVREEADRVVELEWTLYEKIGRTVRASQEIDLVGFAEGTVEFAIEVKRAWWLNGWPNKTRDFLRGILADVEKLGALQAHPSSAAICRGVVVAMFFDTDSERQSGEFLARFPRHQTLVAPKERYVISAEEEQGEDRRIFGRLIWIEAGSAEETMSK